MKTANIKQNQAFSFVEMIIWVWLVILLSFVAISVQSDLNDKTDNTNIEASLQTIKNSLRAYYMENKSLPNPEWNLKYYKKDTSYAHDELDDAYWVSWFIWEKTLSKKYLATAQTDPKTKYYFAYAKTLSWRDNSSFQVAWVLKEKQNYKSIVLVNREKTTKIMKDLIREYNWPAFVEDKSLSHFPYNPERKILTAKIYDFSWSIAITNWINKFTNDVAKFPWYTYANNSSLLANTMIEWASIKVSTWSLATIYFSDGSVSKLWNISSNSELSLAKMAYKNKDSIATKIRLVLNVGTLWTQAPKLWEDSEFETYTDDTIAAVRWTIFGITNYANTASGTNVTLVRWKIEIDKISWLTTTDLFNKLENNETIDKTPIVNVWTITDQNAIIEVKAWENPEWIDVKKDKTDISTWSLDLSPISSEEKNDLKNWEWEAEANQNIDLEALIIKNNWDINISLAKDKLKAFDDLCVNNNCINKTNLSLSGTDTYTLTWGTNLSQATSSTTISLSWSYNTNSWKIELKARKQLIDGTYVYSRTQLKIIALSLFNKENTSLTCPNSFIDPITKTWCVENSLWSDWKIKAYAPYNRPGDLSMYISWSSLWGSNTWIYPDDCLAFTFSNNLFSCDLNWSKQVIPFYQNSSWQNSSFFTLNGTISWILIDNYQYATKPISDFLSYTNITPYLTWDFAIEMSVRGGALRRTNTETFTLFNITNGTNNFYLKYKRTKWLYLWNINIGTWVLWDSISDNNQNTFYKIIAKCEEDTCSLSIPDLNNYSTWNLTQPIQSFTNLYIWSEYNNNAYKNQWNDIIDYVKIYKR